MKIQQMRPGVLHLHKRIENGRQEEPFDILADDEPSARAFSPVIASELDQRCWSVVSFDRLESGSLSYPEAAAVMRDLDERGVSGLCIITDAAAERLKS